MACPDRCTRPAPRRAVAVACAGYGPRPHGGADFDVRRGHGERGARNTCVAGCVSVACDPSFGTWGIDEELRESRLLPGSTDDEGHTVRHICTFVKFSGIAADRPAGPGAVHEWSR